MSLCSSSGVKVVWDDIVRWMIRATDSSEMVGIKEVGRIRALRHFGLHIPGPRDWSS